MDRAVVPPRMSGGYTAGLAAIGAAAATGVMIQIVITTIAGPDSDTGGALFGSPAKMLFDLVMMWMFGCLIALTHMALAMPLYFALHARGWVNWFTAGLSGVLIGAIPLPFLIIVAWGLPPGPPLFVGWLALSGLIGGLAFRAMLRSPA